MTATTDFARPFPALTSAQRLHLEVYGYVVIERAIGPELTRRLRERTYEIEAGYRARGAFEGNAKSLFSASREYFRIDNLPAADPLYLDYVAHPYLVGMAEEIVGSEARLEQSDAHIRRPPADKAAQGYGFHRGAGPQLTWQSAAGLFQCNFVKTLTNLTDLGPDDGGTTVIAGSHKLTHLPADEVIAAAHENPSLIHGVVAPAGSTLLFYEATLHSSGIIRSDNDRVLVIAGYTPAMFQPWEGYDPLPEAPEGPEHLRPLLTGSQRYAVAARVRRLGDAVAGATPASPPAAHDHRG